MDFITDLPSNAKSGAKTLLVITDRLSKGVILIPMLSISAPAVATAFIEHYTSYHRFPKAIVSDRGTQFTSVRMIHNRRLLYWMGKKNRRWSVS